MLFLDRQDKHYKQKLGTKKNYKLIILNIENREKDLSLQCRVKTGSCLVMIRCFM